MRWFEQKGGPTAIRQYAWVWYCALSLVAVRVVGTPAFGRLFTTFMPWDDEGYFFQIFRQFLSGHTLYDEITTIYGPLTFFRGAAVAGFDAASVTHDTFRWAWLPAWVLIAAVLARVVWRWTGPAAPSLVTFFEGRLSTEGPRQRGRSSTTMDYPGRGSDVVVGLGLSI
jgi:hypothetical protein